MEKGKMEILLKGLRFVDNVGRVINTGKDFNVISVPEGATLISVDLSTLEDFTEAIEAKEADGSVALNPEGKPITINIPYTEKVEGSVVVVINVDLVAGKIHSETQIQPANFAFKGFILEFVKHDLDSETYEDYSEGHPAHKYRHQTYPVGARNKKRSKNKAASKARRNNRK